jgi:CBS domain-containing protein
MKIKDVMTRNVQVVQADAGVMEAARMMKDLDVGPLPVVENGRVVGLVTDRDLVVRILAEGRDAKTARVREAMSADVISCREEDDVKDAARTMKEKQIRRLMVLDDQKRVAGIVSLADLAIDTGDQKMAGKVLEKVSTPGH